VRARRAAQNIDRIVVPTQYPVGAEIAQLHAPGEGLSRSRGW
jgi:hypothetical protein